jgi:hypothetical protein
VSLIALACGLVVALAGPPGGVHAVAGKPLLRFVSIGAFKVTLEKTTPDRVTSILGPGKTTQGVHHALRIAYWSADEDSPVYFELDSDDGHTITRFRLTRPAPTDSSLAAPRCRAKANEIVFDQGLSLASSKQTFVARLGPPQVEDHDAVIWAHKRSWQQPASVGGTQMQTWTETYNVFVRFQGEQLVTIDAIKRTSSH